MPLILPNTIANAIPADGDKLQQNFATIVDWANQDAIVSDGSTAMTAPLLLPGAPTQPNQAATKAYVDASVPIGAMWMTAGTAAPTNWMICNGQAISRATYSALFAVCSTRFGAGDGSTTFNLPDLRGRFPIGYYSGNPYSYATTLGGKGGIADAVVPQHLHTIAHVHPFSDTSSTTGVQSASHKHAMRGQAMNGSGGTLGLNLIADDSLTQYPVVNSTGGQDTNHTHTVSVSGNTGAASNGNAGQTGVDPTNQNLPPYQAFNFIIRAL